MKTKHTHLAIASAMMFLLNPFLLNAQWSAVRYDQHNTFHNVSAATANTVFVTGTEPVNSEYFVLRTNDAGVTWDSISFNTATETFQLTQLYFFDANTGFVGGTKNGNQVLLKTTDNGNNWTEITPNPSSADAIRSVHFRDAQNGVATNGTVLYKTSDGGASWTSLPSPFNMRDLFFPNMNSGFACGDNGTAVIMRTFDGGQNWMTFFSAYDSILSVNSFARMEFIYPNVFFTALESSNKLYRTIDGGYTWNTITVSSIDVIRHFDFTSANAGHVLAEIVWAQEYRILLTVDGGQNWTMEYTTGWNAYGGGVVLNAFSFVEQTGYTTGTHGLVKKYFPSVTGISEEEFNGAASVYPNPATSELRIKSRVLGTGLKIERVEIYDAVGKNVFSQQPAASSQQLIINVSSLPPGIYFVKAGNEVRKFIKE